MDSDILSSIGNTPLVELRSVAASGGARILVKLECNNPTGSMKDRMAKAVVEGAAARGRLQSGDTLVEYTGGSTGTSLAFVCAARGFPLRIVTSDAFSREKRDHMRALGANVTELPSEDGRTTRELIQRMIDHATELCRAPATFFVDQFNNPDAASGYESMIDELWTQAGGRIDAFVQCVGTAQCITGAARSLRRRSETIQIVAVEPEESSVLSGGTSGAHKIEGVGPGFVPPLWNRELATEIVSVSTADATAMARRLAREEAIFAGTSTGANVVAAIRVAQRLGPGHSVATIACDSGLKYLSTELYRAG